MYAPAQLPSTTPPTSYATAAAAAAAAAAAFPKPGMHTFKDFLKVPADMVSRVIGIMGKRIDPIRIATGTHIMFRKMMIRM